MKKMKKFLAMLLAMAMVLGMSLTTFAVNHKPVSTDHAEITVNGVKTGATIKAYKVAKGNWTELGFTGYTALEVGGKKIADLEKPTAQEITDIAKVVNSEKGTLVSETSEGSGIYKADLEVGMYLILVTKNGTDDMTAYNPMIASVYYSKSLSGDINDQIGGVVNANDERGFYIDGQTLFAKSMNPGITKEIVSLLEKDNNKYGNDTAIGDVITFEVKTAFPGYSDEYTNVEFNIVDTLSEGLTLSEDSVNVTEVSGATTPPVKDTDYTVTSSTDPDTGITTMTISFISDYILAHRNKDVTVRYNASLNEKAGLNFDKNTNTVKAEYTNNPTTNDKGTTEEKRTYHYTFGIDANINGLGSTVTEELLKTGEVIRNPETGEETAAPLDGATFTLTNKTTGKVYTTISGIGEVGKEVDENGKPIDAKNYVKPSDGYLKFTGLDAGEYELQETKAPEGYTLNPVKIPVEITAEYNTDGTLKSYVIKVDGTVIEKDTEKTSTYTATYKKNDTTGEMDQTPGEVNSDTQKVPNTKIVALPSTGGIGTTIFTIGGCAIMIIAAGLYFASRRKTAK